MESYQNIKLIKVAAYVFKGGRDYSKTCVFLIGWRSFAHHSTKLSSLKPIKYNLFLALVIAVYNQRM